MDHARAFPDFFKVTVTESSWGHVVALGGELDIASAATLQELLVGLGGPTLTVDVSQLSFFDSTGLGSLIRTARALSKDGRKLIIRGLPTSGPLRQLAEMVGGSLFEQS